MERSDRALESTGVAHTAVVWRGLSYRSRQHGVVAMAREPAQMAGQLAFRGRAPQLKLPPCFPLFFFSFLQLKLLACNFSRLASLYLTVHDVRGKAGSSEKRGAAISNA
ncbi:hypothetical protein PAMA_000100 [Pampus argenteus]